MRDLRQANEMHNQNNHKSIMLTSYKFAYSKTSQNETVSYKDVVDHLHNTLGIAVSDSGHPADAKLSQQLQVIFRYIFGPNAYQHQNLSSKATALPEAFFSYLDYLELKQAQADSRSARSTAFWAIAIAIITGVAQIIIGAIQLAK